MVEITKDNPGDFSTPVTIAIDFDKSKVDNAKFDVKNLLSRLILKTN